MAELTEMCRMPVLLLKTKSQPSDPYEDQFRSTSGSSDNSSHTREFSTHFVPVLEHTRHATQVKQLAQLLRSGQLKDRYGGMIFTSQRAVEAWVDVVHTVEDESSRSPTARKSSQTVKDPFSDLHLLTEFPLYVVGPATEHALQSLTDQSRHATSSPFTRLNPSVHGADSGNGAKLGQFIVRHYNQIYHEHWYMYFEAPRLPFIPLLGMSSENYGRKRLEKDDQRLQKKPLCFLVGETRRDIIPKTLTQAEHKILVEEIEVYATTVLESFAQDFERLCAELNQSSADAIRAVVVFSPQGSDTMLKKIGYLDVNDKPTERAMLRWPQKLGDTGTTWIIITIGPTTRDHLKEKYGIDPDICAETPSPDGVKQGIETFLMRHGL